MPELPASWIGHWPTPSLRNAGRGCNHSVTAVQFEAPNPQGEQALVLGRPAGHLAFGILHRFFGAVSHRRASSSFVMASDSRRPSAG